jgi:hypothetical protein
MGESRPRHETAIASSSTTSSWRIAPARPLRLGACGRSVEDQGGTAANRNVALAQASVDEVVPPARVQKALGQLVGSAKEGLLALSVGVGLGVLSELLARGGYEPRSRFRGFGRRTLAHRQRSTFKPSGARRIRTSDLLGAIRSQRASMAAPNMEQLWSRAGTISGNQPQMLRPRKRLKQAKTVATSCRHLPPKAHGKEGVHGSSP